MTLTPKLWMNGQFVQDDFVLCGEADALPENFSIVPLTRLSETAHHANRGVLINPLTPLDALVAQVSDLNVLDVIALNFPVFSNGTSYSKAQILKHQLGFEGQVRAIGDILPDQLGMMLRVGFDALLVTHPIAQDRLEKGELDFHSHFTQILPDDDMPASNAQRFSWRRA